MKKVKAKTLLHTLKPYLHQLKGFLAVIFFLSLSNMVLSFLLPTYYKLFLEEVILQGEISLFLVVATAYMLYYLLTTGISYLSLYLKGKVARLLQARLFFTFLQKFMYQPFEAYTKLDVGRFKTEIEDDIEKIPTFLLEQAMGYIVHLLTLLVSIILLLKTEWRLALLSFFFVPLTLWLDTAFAKRERVKHDALISIEEKTIVWLQDSFTHWRQTRALQLEHRQERHLVMYIHGYAKCFGAWISYWVVRILIIPMVKNEFLMRFLLYFAGGILIFLEHMEIGALLLFMQYNVIFTTAADQLSAITAAFTVNKSAYGRVIDNIEKKIKRRKGINEIGQTTEIAFSDVSFRYDREAEWLFRKISFTLKAGDRVMFLGKSGVGKSTLLSIMAGFLQPTEGEVFFCGRALAEIASDQLFSAIGFVQQDGFLFQDSIAENLLYAKGNASEKEMRQALRHVGLQEFFEELPEGLNTMIGARGIRLSGGERHRLILARMMLKKPRILILDEATSAVEETREKELYEAILHEINPEILIIISHRPHTRQYANRFISLDEPIIKQ